MVACGLARQISVHAKKMTDAIESVQTPPIPQHVWEKLYCCIAIASDIATLSEMKMAFSRNNVLVSKVSGFCNVSHSVARSWILSVINEKIIDVDMALHFSKSFEEEEEREYWENHCRTMEQKDQQPRVGPFMLRPLCLEDSDEEME